METHDDLWTELFGTEFSDVKDAIDNISEKKRAWLAWSDGILGGPSPDNDAIRAKANADLGEGHWINLDKFKQTHTESECQELLDRIHGRDKDGVTPAARAMIIEEIKRDGIDKCKRNHPSMAQLIENVYLSL